MGKHLWRITAILLIAALSFCGCSPASAPAGAEVSDGQEIGNDGMTAEAEALLEEALEKVDELESPVREYGESYGFSQMDGDLMVHILYPVGDIEAMTENIEAWIDEQTAYYEEDAQDYVRDDMKAELTVEYESRILEDKLVCVRMKGWYGAPLMAHPVDVVKTFHGNMETGKMVKLEDLLEDGGMETLRDMAAEDAGVEAEQIDDGLLNHWMLTSDGLEITLARGEYLPMSEGTVVLSYTYEQLAGIVNLSKIPADGREESSEDSDEPEDVLPPDAALPMDQADPDKPMIALTFDDGPSAHTERLLDAFEEHGGKATFFVVGNLINDRKETLVRMAEEGHEIAGHSWNHRQLTSLGKEDLQKQLVNTRAKIYKVTGVDANLMRPPYGSFNDDVKTMCRDHGISLINWSVDTLDWKYRDANTVYQSVMSQAKDGAIILCHDLHGSTVDAMEMAIPALIEKGYQLVTVSQLLTSQGGEVEAGKVYYNR